MAKKYPRIGQKKNWLTRYNKKDCLICNSTATGTIHVEYNHFRGDDGVYSVCETHRKSTVAQLVESLK